MSMKHITPEDYNYIRTTKDWTDKIISAEITFHIKKGDIYQTIKTEVEPQGKGLYETLVEKKIISPDLEEAPKNFNLRDNINGWINSKVNKKIKEALGEYEKGVKIYNQLADLVVKDKRTSVYYPELNNGAVKREEIRLYNRTKNIGNEEFEFALGDGHYYSTELKFAHPDITTEGCTCFIKFMLEANNEPWGDRDKDEDIQRWDLPDFELEFKCVTDNRIDGVETIKEQLVDLIYIEDRGKFNSYFIQDDSRKVSLNTFIAMARHHNRNIREKMERNIIHKANASEVIAKLKEMYPGLPIHKKEINKTYVNKNYYSFWSGSRYVESLSVTFPDESILYYSYPDACKNKALELMGVNDVSVMTPEQSIKKIINQNK